MLEIFQKACIRHPRRIPEDGKAIFFAVFRKAWHGIDRFANTVDRLAKLKGLKPHSAVEKNDSATLAYHFHAVAAFNKQHSSFYSASTAEALDEAIIADKSVIERMVAYHEARIFRSMLAKDVITQAMASRMPLNGE